MPSLEEKIDTPIFHCHGEDDVMISMERGHKTSKALTELARTHMRAAGQHWHAPFLSFFLHANFLLLLFCMPFFFFFFSAATILATMSVTLSATMSTSMSATAMSSRRFFVSEKLTEWKSETITYGPLDRGRC